MGQKGRVDVLNSLAMPDAAQENKSYKSTLNLPKTSFPMKANLVQHEPVAVERWKKLNLYKQIRQARSGAPRYLLHDGPPYANGSIHLGHVLNKVLKDMVVRSKTMAGYDCPYVPGWDCHGLPIEHKVMKDLTDPTGKIEPFRIRRKCKAYAEKFVKLQSRQMQRLLTLADYDHPYLTMDCGYESAVLDVFADLLSKGLVYRALKPVHWSVTNQTALADAELEYDDREDTSVYVLFNIANPSLCLPGSLGFEGSASQAKLMIWTTTPWTLPANMAVSVHPDHEYGLYRVDGGRGHLWYIILATKLAEDVFSKREVRSTLLGACCGSELCRSPASEAHRGVMYEHPFAGRQCPVVAADYVTLEDGTGLVHTAPGHGVEDYQTGVRYRLHFDAQKTQVRVTTPDGGGGGAQMPDADIYCPVREDGSFDDTVPQWIRGHSVWAGNRLIVQWLRDHGCLFHDHVFTHSYPLDWRSKTPVIFRATEQWFVSVDGPHPPSGDPQRFPNASLRRLAMTATDRQVKFLPEWGRNRMRGMIESRPDWCLSRQRSWGLPIPAFFGPEQGQILLTAATVRVVAGHIRTHGSDVWFKAAPEQLLAGYDPAADPDAPEWLRQDDGRAITQLTKASDIFDVWFESGSSWNAVLRQRDMGYPADLYLEGSDQHRGWFQLSLLPALGVTGQSPFRSVLTHGFMVDKNGRKMSKSGGNALEVDTLLKDFGADVCRWWVGSLNPDNDIKVDHTFFRVAGEEYRKVRNTIRFLLSNLSDFNLQTDRCRFTETDATSLDAWALAQMNRLIDQVLRAYEVFQFRKVHDAIFHFCNETMSAVYLVATKDRLYCDKPDSPRRRRTQTAIHRIVDALVRLVAPVLPHTADEAWQALYGADSECVHLTLMPERQADLAVDRDWDRLMAVRAAALKVIETARAGSGIDNPMDCGLRVTLGQGAQEQSRYLIRFDPVDLADLCGVSRVEIHLAERPSSTDLEYEVVDLRDQQPRCQRCWKRDGTVKRRRDGGMLSDRDARVLGLDDSP